MAAKRAKTAAQQAKKLLPNHQKAAAKEQKPNAAKSKNCCRASTKLLPKQHKTAAERESTKQLPQISTKQLPNQFKIGVEGAQNNYRKRELLGS